MIRLEQLAKRYDDVVAVAGLDLEVARGEVLVLLGSSGCGKTTTLKMINRLIEPSSGRVWIDGEDAASLPGPALRRRIGYVFQGIGLFPHLTVAENVGVTPGLLDWDPERIARRVDALLGRGELPPDAFRERWPHERSGGQLQRVGLVRALAAEPALLLLDEPFGALDPLTRDRLQQAFRALQRDLDRTAVFVTHDMVEALLIGDRIAVMNAGRLVQVGTPQELLAAPADAYVAELMATPRRQTEVFERFLHGAGG